MKQNKSRNQQRKQQRKRSCMCYGSKTPRITTRQIIATLLLTSTTIPSSFYHDQENKKGNPSLSPVSLFVNAETKYSISRSSKSSSSSSSNSISSSSSSYSSKSHKSHSHSRSSSNATNKSRKDPERNCNEKRKQQKFSKSSKADMSSCDHSRSLGSSSYSTKSQHSYSGPTSSSYDSPSTDYSYDGWKDFPTYSPNKFTIPPIFLPNPTHTFFPTYDRTTNMPTYYPNDDRPSSKQPVRDPDNNEKTPTPTRAPQNNSENTPAPVPSIVFTPFPSSSTEKPIITHEPTNKPTTYPTVAPTTQCGVSEIERSLQIKTALVPISGLMNLNNPESLQFRAFQWLTQRDNYVYCPNKNSNDNSDDIDLLTQRYILALLYFSTNGDEWFLCSRDELDSPCYDLETGLPKIRYLSDENECQWYGNTCDEFDRLTIIDLEINNLSGNIPFELLELPHLKSLNLSKNEQIGGNLQETLFQKKYDERRRNYENGLEMYADEKYTPIERIDLHGNTLTGTIPDGLFSLRDLNYLDLHSNQLSGTISDGFQNLLHLGMLSSFSLMHPTYHTR